MFLPHNKQLQSFPLPLSSVVCRVSYTTSLSAHSPSPTKFAPPLPLLHTLAECQQHMQHSVSPPDLPVPYAQKAATHISHASTSPRTRTSIRHMQTVGADVQWPLRCPEGEWWQEAGGQIAAGTYTWWDGKRQDDAQRIKNRGEKTYYNCSGDCCITLMKGSNIWKGDKKKMTRQNIRKRSNLTEIKG